jgi:uncharacterized protein YdhG (YjbR/CyaY superfamily)
MKGGTKADPAKDVDEYLASVPAQERVVLAELRRTIRQAAPMAEERISYRMPAYLYHGPLVFFAAFGDHLSFFGVSKEVIERFKSELAPYRTSTTTLHFSADHPLPASLVGPPSQARRGTHPPPASQICGGTLPAPSAGGGLPPHLLHVQE